MADDAEFIKLLERLIESAKKNLDIETINSRFPSQSLWEIAGPIAAALNEHPEFKEQNSKFFLGKQLLFSHRDQSINILRMAVHHGAASAVDWYRRIKDTKSTNMRVVAEVYGLIVEREYHFSNGVKIVPVSNLSDGPNSRALKGPYPIGSHKISAAAAVYEVFSDEDSDRDTGQNGRKEYLSIIDKMKKTISAFVISKSAAPIITENWAEFFDPEMEAAESGVIWGASRHEGQIPRIPQYITKEMIEWVEKYINLPKDVSERCDTSIDRLNLAHRRVALGDMAIDSCIGIESLLSDSEGDALNHKLSVRAALLLGRSLAERREIKRKIKDIYRIRSKMVHGKKDADSSEREVVENGISVGIEILRAIISSKRIPAPEEWELTGGPEWNRYSES